MRIAKMHDNSSSKKYAIGIDLGGSTVALGVVNLKGKIISEIKRPTMLEQGQQEVFKKIFAMLKEALNKTNVSSEEILGIGIGLPGLIDPTKGLLLQSPNLSGWENVPVRAIFEKEFNLSTFIEHDSAVWALGEKWCGLARGCDDFLCITLGTGIGLGIFCNGNIVRGAHFHAGELGHITIEKDAPLCGCGNRGCLEKIAAGPAIVRAAQKAVEEKQDTIITDIVRGRSELVTTEIVFKAALKRDTIASDIVARAGDAIGLAISILILILDPEMIIIGGGIAQAGDLLLNRIGNVVKKRAYSFQDKLDKIVFSQLGDKAGILGAAYLIMNSMK